MIEKCLICEKPVPDYEPEFCCNGQDCGCRGQPMEPCVCSNECYNAVIDYIGHTMDERRTFAGIEKWSAEGKVTKLEIKRSADFSECRTWRYTLKRVWDNNLPAVLFVLLNPSTADEVQDDPTNRRGIGYARRWGCGGVTFVNLFAYRTPYPKELKKADNPVGPDNNYWILKEALDLGKYGKVILAWGTHGTLLGRDKQVTKMLRDHQVKPLCMGVTKGGHPKHILYLKGDLEPELFGKEEEGESE